MSGSGGSDDWKYRGTSQESQRKSGEGTGSNADADGSGEIGTARSGVGSSGGGASSKCEIFEETALNSPNDVVIKTLHLGDILTLVLTGRTVIALTADGRQAGSITFRRLADLLECMDQHWGYVAVVKRITGGMCQVYIRPEVRP